MSTENRLTLDTDSQVFFYEQDHYYLSNFSAFSIDWMEERYYTAEHAYQAEKFRGSDYAVMLKILYSPSAHEAFKLAQSNRASQRREWHGIKVGIMKRILRAKTDQHQYVRRKLLETGTRELIENSWRDHYWGWGPNRDGINVLGKLWMEIREEIRTESYRG